MRLWWSDHQQRVVVRVVTQWVWRIMTIMKTYMMILSRLLMKKKKKGEVLR